MSRKIYLWVFIGVTILVAGLLSGFVLMQPSAQDLLVQAIESAESIQDGHAVLTVNVDTVEKEATGTVEVWGRRGEDRPGAFRIEVLESSEAKANGAVIVSDGETLWAYSPSENKVVVGTLEEAKAMMAEQEFEGYKFGDRDTREGDFTHPENAEEAVQKLLEYFNVAKAGSDTIAGSTAQLLKLDPIPEKMPSEYTAVGGFINLWIDQSRNVPLAVEYTGGSFGEVSVTASELVINEGVDETLFSFEIPAGAEIVSFADLQPKPLTLEEAAVSAEFQFLTPGETPQGAVLVDILQVRGAIVQRFTLPDGGSFSIVQGKVGDTSGDGITPPSAEKQVVEVRGVMGSLFTSKDGDQVMLTWSDGDLFYSLAGDLTADQALVIAESLQ